MRRCRCVQAMKQASRFLRERERATARCALARPAKRRAAAHFTMPPRYASCRAATLPLPARSDADILRRLMLPLRIREGVSDAPHYGDAEARDAPDAPRSTIHCQHALPHKR